MSVQDIDTLDVLFTVGGIILTAATVPIVGVPVAAGIIAQHWMRRTDTAQNVLNRKATSFLLPPPTEVGDTHVHMTQSVTVPVNIQNNKDGNNRWWQDITKPLPTQQIVNEIQTTGRSLQEVVETDITKKLAQLPPFLLYKDVDEPPTKTSVPIGYNNATGWLWADFSKDTIHALIAGQTGAGKDTQLRLWFTMLTANNTPEEVQFSILDGKGEWLVPALMSSAHMFTPPAGGVDVVKNDKGQWVDRSNDHIQDAIGKVFDEVARRNKLFQEVGATNLESYERKTGSKLPMLFIIGTDLGTNIEKDLETLVKMLTFKGRSFGIRLILSMQTVAGQDTGWRSNLALIMSGFQQMPSQDVPVMGVPAAMLQVRPSALPSPDVPANRGIFVVRKGHKQFVVRAPYLPDEDFELYIENRLPTMQDWKQVNEPVKEIADDDYLNQLLMASLPVRKEPLKTVDTITLNDLTKKEKIRILSLVSQGHNKSSIMHQMGYTGAKWKKYGALVDRLMLTTKGK